MKRWLPAGIAALGILAAGLWLGKPVVNPGDFSGQWYCTDGSQAFVFESGLIFSDSREAASGAYVYSRNKVFLYASNVPGLERERELYLVRGAEGDILCEKENGTGTVYFCRKA